ncbi:MAG: PAS domain-containing sensor histidine kinase [Myxococcota bacterium]
MRGVVRQKVVILTPDGSLLGPQADWEAMTGEHADYDGFGWIRSLHPEDRERVLQRWRQEAPHGLAFGDEYRLRDENGRYRSFSVRAAPIHADDQSLAEYLVVFHDVSERRNEAERTTQALDALNDLKAAIDEHAIVAITDARGRITYVNEKFCAISRYPREELIGQDHRIINSGHHPKPFIQNLWQTISSGRVWKGEIKNKAKDGTLYWVDTTIVPYLGADGKPIQYIAIRADITERKRAEERMASAMRELNDVKAALDHHAIVAVTNPRGTITYVNDKFCAISKYTREELIGQDHRIINSGHHPREFIRGLWQTIGDGRVWKGEIKNKAKDGTFYWVDTTIVPYLGEDGKPFQYIAIRADITDRKLADEQTNQALRELNDVKSALDEHAIVAITDARGRITYVNDKFCAISKYPRHELLGQDHRIINSHHHPKEFIRSIWQAIGDGRVWKGEIKNKAKDGTFYWVDTTIVPYLGVDGRPVQYIAIRADITERKEAETALHDAQVQLQRHATTLEETVELRTAALRDTIGELEAFSYSVSHDMRAPLRAMQSFSKILAEECADEVSPVGQDYIRRINSAAARMDSLIKDVLTYSRVTRTELSLEPVSLDSLLRDIIDTYPSLQEPAARVEIIGVIPDVLAIPAVLTQCVSNLLGNAVKFVGADVSPFVQVWAEDRGAHVRISFKDNGFGIESDALERIFGIFQRVSTSHEGTGIGLAIVKKGVERLGGAVGVVSSPGSGSTFWLDLRKSPPDPNHA